MNWRKFLTQESFTSASLKNAFNASMNFEKCPTHGYCSTDRHGQPRDAVLAELGYLFSQHMQRLHFVWNRMEHCAEPEKSIHKMFFNEEKLLTLSLLRTIETRGSLFGPSKYPTFNDEIEASNEVHEQRVISEHQKEEQSL